nr:putative ribonuclease H-like domain-containing protein [Tanacetum cinerariifolium]
MAASLPVCLLSKATSIKSWLWHHRLSHLNFGTINDLTKHDLGNGLPKFKYSKNHLCSACERGKIKKSPHPPNVVPSNHSNLELLHMNLCEPMRVASINERKNGIAKWPTYSSDVDGFCNGDELPGMVRVGSMTNFQDHKCYDELVDGKLKNETLAFKGKVEESWENATPSDCKGSVTSWDDLVAKFVQKFYQLSDHKDDIEKDDDPDDIAGIFKIEGNLFDFETPMCKAFNNFNQLLKIDKINADKVAPFTRSKSYDHGPYANIKTKWAHDPYLEVDNIFGRNYDISNTQDNQRNDERMDDPTLEPSVCKIRRFKMTKYSFNIDEEYIAIKESEYRNHSKHNLGAYQELLHIINQGWVMTTTDEE